MRIKALLTTLLLGSTLAGVASADPIVRDHRNQPSVSYTRSRTRVVNRPSWMPQYNATYGYQVDFDGDEVTPYNQGHDPNVEGIARGEWMNIAPSVRFAYAKDTVIELPIGGERLQSLELQATRGRSYVREVRVQLNDGRVITLQPSRLLDAKSAPNLRLDLGPSAWSGIRKIELVGHTTAVGSFRVLAA